MGHPSRRQFLSSIAFGAGALALSGCGSSANTAEEEKGDGAYKLVTPGVLTCVAELHFPPFDSMDEKTGEPIGFDIDVSNALAKQLGLEVKWLPSQNFDTLVPTIKAGGTADIALSAITITDARLAEVDMTDPYLDSNQSIVVEKNSAETTESLNDASKKIAVQSGTTGESWAQENLPDAQIVPLDDVVSAMNGTVAGRYDAIVVDLPVSKYQITNSFSDLKVLEEIPTGEQYGMVVSKSNPGLTAAINEALQAIKDDGTFAQIQTTWFGEEIQ